MAPSSSLDSRSIYVERWRIDISVRPGVARLLSHAALARTVTRGLEAAGAPQRASIGLILSDDSELAGLNARHMGKDGPTDVLSFPLLSRAAFPDHPGRDPAAAAVPAAERAAPAIEFALPPGRRLYLGDIVVSVERAIDQAGAGRGGQTGDVRWSAADELRLLVTHGTLHVCGWDHAAPAEEASMRALEQELLGRQVTA